MKQQLVIGGQTVFPNPTLALREKYKWTKNTVFSVSRKTKYWKVTHSKWPHLQVKATQSCGPLCIKPNESWELSEQYAAMLIIVYSASKCIALQHTWGKYLLGRGGFHHCSTTSYHWGILFCVCFYSLLSKIWQVIFALQIWHFLLFGSLDFTP